MNDIIAASGLIGLLILLILIIAGILMPIAVICIDSRVSKIQKTLAAMEHMMRHGK